MSASTDFLVGPAPRLTARESVLWGGAAAVVLAAHLAVAYVYYAEAPEPPAAEAVQQALKIDLTPLSVSTPESVAAQEAQPSAPPETLKPVEEAEPLASQTVEPVERSQTSEPLAPSTPEEMKPLAEPESQAAPPETIEPLQELSPLEVPAAPAEEPVPSRSEPQASPPDALARATPDEITPADPDQVVLPREDAPVPTPRPEPPVRRAEATPKRETRPEPQPRTRDKQADTRQREPAAQAARGGASTAPRFDPARWQTKVVAWLNRHKRYPNAARSRGEEGTANVTFTIDSSGRVISARIAHSSGSRLLDQAALDMVRRSSPVPAPPAEIARGSMTLGVPVNFQMR